MSFNHSFSYTLSFRLYTSSHFKCLNHLCFFTSSVPFWKKENIKKVQEFHLSDRQRHVTYMDIINAKVKVSALQSAFSTQPCPANHMQKKSITQPYYIDTFQAITQSYDIFISRLCNQYQWSRAKTFQLCMSNNQSTISRLTNMQPM